MNLGLIFKLPGEARNVINAFKQLTSGAILAQFEADPTVSGLVAQIKSDVATLEADINAFAHDSFFGWLKDATKFGTDTITIGMQLYGVYTGLPSIAWDVASSGAFKTILTAVTDLGRILSDFGVKLPFNNLLDMATRAQTVTKAAAVTVSVEPVPVPAPSVFVEDTHEELSNDTDQTMPDPEGTM
jgi:hypothetical protein